MGLMDIHTFSVERKLAGSYVKGVWTVNPTGPTSFPEVVGSVQPLTGKDLLKVPEADREREHIEIFSSFAFAKKDIVIYEGVRFEVNKIDDWTTFDNHGEVIAIRENAA